MTKVISSLVTSAITGLIIGYGAKLNGAPQWVSYLAGPFIMLLTFIVVMQVFDAINADDEN